MTKVYLIECRYCRGDGKSRIDGIPQRDSICSACGGDGDLTVEERNLQHNDKLRGPGWHE
jgi:hypothetical protein